MVLSFQQSSSRGDPINMALADVLEARKQLETDEGYALVSAQSTALEGGQPGAPAPRPTLSREAERVLHDAWVENSLHAYGAPIDTSDLLIGLMGSPKTGAVLDHFGITPDRVRARKRNSHGYQLASRFTAVAERKAAKTRQVGRVARLLAENSLLSGKTLIEPEDILELLAVDGLGWGMGIMEELGLTEELLTDGLASVDLLDDGSFAMSGAFLARWRAAEQSRLGPIEWPAAIGRLVARLVSD